MCFSLIHRGFCRPGLSGCPRLSRGRGGFTFIEIMVVVVIIGLLAGAVALRVTGNVAQARQNRAKSDIATIVTAIETYRLNTARLPTNAQGLSVLPIDRGVDPWGRAYQYNVPGPAGEEFEVVSYGADGRPGGEDEDADVVSWDLAVEARP
ncbi:MAG: type II secretion system protein GspG [Planctomycetota bacterium]